MVSILLIETPISCWDCPCHDSEFDVCKIENECMSFDIDNCPLKPLPIKKEVKEITHSKDIVYTETQYDYIANKIVGKINYDVETIFNKGYNSCLDEILGEEHE